MRFHTGFHPIRPLSIPLFFLLLFLVSCSGSGSDTGTNPPPDQAPVATATIGPAGGAIGTDEVTVTVPPGALDQEYDLAIYTEDLAGIPPCISGPFRLAGLPGEVNGSLSFRLPVGQGNAEEFHIGLRHPEFTSESGDTLWVLSYPPGEISDGFMTIQWPADHVSSSDGMKTMTGPGGDEVLFNHLTIFSLGGMVFRIYPDCLNPRFRMFLPVNIQSEADNTFAALEGAYAKYQELGFDFSVVCWPDSVLRTIEIGFDLDYAPDGYVISRAQTMTLGFCIGSRQTWLPYLDVFRWTVDENTFSIMNRELQSHLIQLLLDARNPACTRYTAREERDVMAWAYGCWAERLFYPDPEHTPTECLGKLGAAGTCLKKEGWTAADHFAPLAALFTYLADDSRYGVQVLKDILAGLEGLRKDPCYVALRRNLPSDGREWWPDFFRRLVSGEIYTVTEDEFLVKAESAVRLDRSDQELSIGSQFDDLTAKYYRLDLDCPDWTEDTTLDLSLSRSGRDESFEEVQVYAIGNGTPQYLVSGSGVSIGNLAGLQADGRDLLVVVTEAYNDPDDENTVPVTLEVAVSTPATGSDIFQLETADIRLGSAPSSWTYEGEECSGGGGTGSVMFTWENKPGQWQGTTFTADWDDSWDDGGVNYHDTGSLSIVMDQAGQSILDWHSEDTLVRTDETATTTTVTEADWVGTDIPRNPDPGSWTARYTLSGSQIGSQVSISRVITWAGVDCRATLNLGTWYGYSFLQVGFAP